MSYSGSYRLYTKSSHTQFLISCTNFGTILQLSNFSEEPCMYQDVLILIHNQIGSSNMNLRQRVFTVYVIFHTLTQNRENKTDMKQLVTLVNIAHACSTIIAPQIDTDGLNPLHHQCLLSYIYIVCPVRLLIVLSSKMRVERKIS